MINIGLTLTIIIVFAFFLLLNSRHKSPPKSALICAIGGTGSLLLSAIVLKLFGTVIAVNIFTVLISIGLGVPGTVLVILYTVFC